MVRGIEPHGTSHKLVRFPFVRRPNVRVQEPLSITNGEISAFNNRDGSRRASQDAQRESRIRTTNQTV